MLEISRRAFRHKPLCERKGVRVRFHHVFGCRSRRKTAFQVAVYRVEALGGGR